MKLFVFITDEWGSGRGGINSLNADLVLACARVTKNDKSSRIICAIPDLSHNVRQSLEKEGIIPVTLSAESYKSREAAKLIFDGIQGHPKLRPYFPDCCNTFCIGHDVHSGALSKKLADMCDGWNIVFHHMDYESYYLQASLDPIKYDEKVAEQHQILNNADKVFGVGPLLYDSADNITRMSEHPIAVEQFIPGLMSVEALSRNSNKFIPIVFGRIEENNQVIKQTALAIDSFANAIARDKDDPIIGYNATLNVYGYDKKNNQLLMNEVKRLQKEAKQIAGRICNVVPHSFLTDRKALTDAIRSSSAAMMLSFYEGFGLVGYEAIAAGVPLILTRNSGLYQFLEARGLDHLVHVVDIEGSNDPKGYSENDLTAVTNALRDIRRNESKHKDKAMKLLKLLMDDPACSWDACAQKFLDDVQANCEVDPPKFFAPDDVTSLQERIGRGEFGQLAFRPVSGKRVYSVTGKDALASVCVWLKNSNLSTYLTYIYSEKSEDPQTAYSDLFDSCRAFFGKENDEKGPGFGKVLTERLRGRILILDNIPLEPKEKFNALLARLNKSTVDFYIFSVHEQSEPVRAMPYQGDAVPALSAPVSTAPVSLTLTDSQKLLAKILAFREEDDYRDYLIGYICRGLNDACAELGRTAVIEEPQKQVQALLNAGLIKAYSTISYKNTEACLAAARETDVDMVLYARGLAAMGRSYARSFYAKRDTNPDLKPAYFGCKCYAQAAFMDEAVKTAIQPKYEALLKSMRIQAKFTSDYSQYHQALRCYLDLYQDPIDMWRWYDLLHCETIYSPSMDTLTQLRKLINSGAISDHELKLQMIRLHAEMEFNLNIPGALKRFTEQIDAVAETDRIGTPWEQSLNALISIAICCGELDTAERYLGILESTCGDNNSYSRIILAALRTELDTAHHFNGDAVDLGKTFFRIRSAHTAAKQLRDARGIGWTQGLLGECQYLRGDLNGEKTLRNSMENRAHSEESSRMYHRWLLRLKQYDLKDTGTIRWLNKEIERTEKKIQIRREQKKHQVFISYNTRDQEQAERIVEQIEANSISCWIAPRDVPIGSSYIKEIPRAISTCSHFVLVQSENSQESQWVDKELILAINHKKRILPLMIRDHTIDDKFSFLLSNVQFRPYYQEQDAVIREISGLILSE